MILLYMGIEGISDRISYLVDQFADGKNTKFAELVDTSETNIRNYRSGKVLPKIDFIYNIGKKFEISFDWLLSGIGEPFNKQGLKNEPVLTITEPKLSLSRKEMEFIEVPIVDISAAAGHGFLNPDYVEQLGTLKMPANMVKKGLNYWIRNRGFSMSPTLKDSDLVMVKYIDPMEWQDMPDGHVCLVVDRDGMAYLKRVKNRFEKGFIVLMSDSVDKVNYPNFNLQADEISNIFHAEWHLSAKMENINETYYNRLKSVEDRLEEMENKLRIGGN